MLTGVMWFFFLFLTLQLDSMLLKPQAGDCLSIYFSFSYVLFLCSCGNTYCFHYFAYFSFSRMMNVYALIYKIYLIAEEYKHIYYVVLPPPICGVLLFFLLIKIYYLRISCSIL